MNKRAIKKNLRPKAKKGTKLIHNDDSEEININDANLQSDENDPKPFEDEV
jgi:hypothetical protein